MESFDTKDTPLSDTDENTYSPVKAILADAAGPFTQGLAQGVGSLIDISRGGGVNRAIVLRAQVEEMDPGSRSARYWAGFGAGAARTRLAGEAVDSERPARYSSASSRSGAPRHQKQFGLAAVAVRGPSM